MSLKSKFSDFIQNKKEYPLFGGIIIGLYAFLFYYSNNFENANSISQLLFFIGYYILIPSILCFFIDKIIIKTRFRNKRRQILFIILSSSFTFYIGQNINFHHTFYKIFLILFGLIVLISYKINNYKIMLVIVSIMSLIPLFKIGIIFSELFNNNNNWTIQPDEIEKCQFKKRPNIYYIQMDGYTNQYNLRNQIYDIDNSEFDSWLSVNNFTHYEKFRSNYSTTLKSNSSSFMMKHHYSKEKTGFKNARDYILGNNPTLNIFKQNNYKTLFITERPYLLSNRPKIEFDYCNFNYNEVPYIRDGWGIYKEIFPELKNQILKNKETSNFYFIESFTPSHIAVHKNGSLGKEKEREKYKEKIKSANQWLKETITFINNNDSEAIIIIAADHGGFVGFNYTLESIKKTENKILLNSIFGAKLAIKWNSFEKSHTLYDKKLKTSVNLFRTLFSYLSENKNLINNYQKDDSYAEYDKNDDSKVYKALE
ncbi:hypothetical protein LXD69_13240 [Flavobacterium sediminilitoris]|uniref:Sulfatase N-terminal domain-containing protein n=1 Tax=Flavobacterium sediminilitoris TaxID=2024526 RepID=A0ABY4HJI8_9FLAO|nr:MULTISPECIES: hypothetical protein [Flavobacterium]UOX32998.1 hypothetical protein LXD69_13240 [Flavobacterium sediminilitoris]